MSNTISNSSSLAPGVGVFPSVLAGGGGVVTPGVGVSTALMLTVSAAASKRVKAN
jgi:hypothetical protein